MRPDPLILALDFESAAEARALVSALGTQATFFKVGLELFTGAGMEIVQELCATGKQVFLDLKLHDIGETVRRATAVVAQSGATFLTVHGSVAVMRAAVAGRGDSPLRLLAVTVLTSMDDRDLQEDGYDRGVSELVERRARQAAELGVDGIILSPRETARIRKQVGPKLLLVTPGVRSRGMAAGDQKRIATPAEALADGADYLVIGRQVTRAAEPARALAGIREEIAGSYESR